MQDGKPSGPHTTPSLLQFSASTLGMRVGDSEGRCQRHTLATALHFRTSFPSLLRVLLPPLPGPHHMPCAYAWDTLPCVYALESSPQVARRKVGILASECECGCVYEQVCVPGGVHHRKRRFELRERRRLRRVGVPPRDDRRRVRCVRGRMGGSSTG